MAISRSENLLKREMNESEIKKGMKIGRTIFHLMMIFIVSGAILSFLVFIDYLQNPKFEDRFDKINPDDYEFIYTEDSIRVIKKDKKQRVNTKKIHSSPRDKDKINPDDYEFIYTEDSIRVIKKDEKGVGWYWYG